MEFKNGSQLKAIWKSDLPTKGEFIFNDGAVFSGNFKEGKLTGFGKFQNKTGDKYKGN